MSLDVTFDVTFCPCYVDSRNMGFPANYCESDHEQDYGRAVDFALKLIDYWPAKFEELGVELELKWKSCYQCHCGGISFCIEFLEETKDILNISDWYPCQEDFNLLILEEKLQKTYNLHSLHCHFNRMAPKKCGKEQKGDKGGTGAPQVSEAEA